MNSTNQAAKPEILHRNMVKGRTRISVKGRQVEVPFIHVNGFDIVVRGRWPRLAEIRSEPYTEKDPAADPEKLIRGILDQHLGADIFSFVQRIPDSAVRYPYHVEWDNVAAIPLTTFNEWWEPLPQATRKNVRRSERRGVTVKISVLDRSLAEGIKSIYDETPVRQGRLFWHYGKDVETVLRENSSYLERSDFITAHYNNELIGIIKLVYVGRTAQILQIVSKNQHFDKRPTNALLAAAIDLCCRKGISFLVYGKYVYGNSTDSALIEFKRRNGFKQMIVPRYYVPLTFGGTVAIKLKLHLGLRGLLPTRLERVLFNLRSKYYEKRLSRCEPNGNAAEPDQSSESVAGGVQGN